VGVEQIDLDELLSDEGVSKSTHEAIWKKVRKQAEEAAKEIGIKAVAGAFEMSPSGLEHALAERNRARLSGEQLVYLQVMSKHDTLSAIVPEIRGMQLVPAKPLTPEEECARWRSLADQMGIQGDWMKKQVFRRSTKL
jgi:hypothetical protein